MNIAIVGSRLNVPIDATPDDIARVMVQRKRAREEIRLFTARLPAGTRIISGGAGGIDSFAREAAASLGLPFDEYPADWNTHGTAAGFIRNRTVVEVADRIEAWWNGKSRGTLHTIRLARGAGKPVTVHPL